MLLQHGDFSALHD
jgi:hypothetical protein